MKTEVNLADLVMLQMMGRLDSYFDRLESAQSPVEMIESLRASSSVPGLFEDIVDKSIRTQFGQTNTTVRELGQNARDSYERNAPNKRIEFTTSYETDSFVLSVRDYGKGMSGREVVQNLLVPYNSGKDQDLEKIGEHGIGWYSILDFADSVEVISGNGKKTVCKVHKSGDTWQADIETLDGRFEGTEVRAYAPNWRVNVQELRESLEKHLGRVSSEDFEITFDGSKINTIDREYTQVGAVQVPNKGGEDDLSLMVKRNGERYRNDKVVLTQDGLFVKEEDIPFQHGTIHYDFMSAIMDEGVEFWVDLPRNIGLTKGRNNVVSKDRTFIYDGIYPAFEQYIVDFVLSDSWLVGRLDSKLSDFIKNMFDDKYTKFEIENQQRKQPKGESLERRISATSTSEKNDDKQPSIEVYGVDAFEGLKKKEITDEKARVLAESAKRYIDNMSDFALRIFQKKFISASKYVGEERESLTVSIEDMIKAYTMDVLFDEYSYRSSKKEDGIYVRSDNRLVRTVFQQLNEKFEKKKATGKISTNDEAPNTSKHILKHSDLETIKRLTDGEQVGYEYRAFLEAANYVENVLSKAAGIDINPVMIYHSDVLLDGNVIAHTDHKGIAFNLANKVTEGIIEGTRTGSYDYDTFMKLLDIVIHEKAHCVRGEFDAKKSHGMNFYGKTKKELREAFVSDCVDKKIDPLGRVNSMLGNYDYSQPLNRKGLAELVDKYTGSS